MSDFRNLGHSKLPIFSTISFTAVLLIIIFVCSFISNLSLQTVVLEAKKISLNSFHEDQPKLRWLSTKEVLFSVTEEVDEEPETEDYTHFLTPFNGSDQERIDWFKKKLPGFDIFKSTILTREFDDRVRGFLGNEKCRVKFFMTWISPVRLFGGREFLALESLFNSHPDGCLVILSRTMDSFRGHRILRPLLDCGFRAISVTPDLSFLFEDTPAQSWFDDLTRGNKDPGEIPLAQNLSNLIRLAVLYKYGGVYLDTDFVVLKDFLGLRNSIGAQSVDQDGNWTRLNNAVLVFDKNHPLLYKFMEEFASTFNGNKWGYNGPYLVSRVVERMEQGQERNFTILPPMAFYPVDWTRIAGLFARPVNRAHSKWVEAKLVQLSNASYGVHLWNKESSRLRIEEGSIIGRLVSKNCVICKQIYSS
ncbi:alpha 1,4-glycosyltransferase family protein [Actinidia rufa]|uniref:Alpha 1,4-glycosyltransferase family protein n=1 Tax=Actinidia rufa TaxID=165716 RepID=A0A7J0EBC2_9ERIC|nr:alpha 1,4-glycosyltransferase family protein [Actinidia rufa]